MARLHERHYAELFSPHAWGKIIVIDHGIVDGKPLFSRYAHVAEIEISVGEPVSAGDPIATVGNAEGLFPYHLHFDISLTDRLRDEPNHWPGPFRGQVLAHYVDPKEWLRVKVSGDTEPTVQVYYVIATLGVRVRESHGTSATQVGLLSYGSRVSLEDAERVDEDAYTWARIGGGMYNSDWLAMGKSDQSETYVSRNPPGP